MPLIKDIGKKAFQKNVKAELAAGKPVKQAVAIAYAVKREAATKKKKKYWPGFLTYSIPMSSD